MIQVPLPVVWPFPRFQVTTAVALR
jgi:hypothetical protein